MKKIEYQAPEMEVIEIKVQNAILQISYSGDQPESGKGEDGDVAD